MTLTRSSLGPWLVTAVCAAGASSLAHAQSVLIVDASGAGTHTSFTSAVDAASDGDTIIVRSGAYTLGLTPFVIQGKGLRIFGEEGSYPVLLGRLELRNIGAGSDFVMDHMVINSIAELDLGGLEVRNCEGPVWLEDMFVDAAGTPLPGIRMDNVDIGSLSFINAFGGDEQPPGSPSAIRFSPGLDIEDSRVFASTCFSVGGSKPVNEPGFGFGGNSVDCDSSALTLRSCILVGGDGITNAPVGGGPTNNSGDGGDCINVVGAGNTIGYDELTELSFQPGIAVANPFYPPGVPGVEVDDKGTGTVLPALPLETQYSTASATSAVQQTPGVATPITVTVGGPVGGEFRLFAAFGPTDVPQDLDLGVLLDATRIPYLSGTVSGASSSNTYTIDIPPFPAGFGSFTLYCQAVGVNGSNAPFVPGSTHMVVVYE